MFLVSEAMLLPEKNGFSSHSGNKPAVAIVYDFGRNGFGCSGDMRIRIYDDNGGVGGGLQRRMS